MFSRVVFATAALAVICGAGCSRDGDSRALSRYLLTGSSTVAPVMQKLAEGIEAREPDFRIDVQTGGSTRGIVDATQGQNDAGMASRDLKSDEAAGLTVVPIAYDGVALIVHADNPVAGLSADQVRGLFKKEITTWDAVGGPSGDVMVVNKAEGRATLEVFLDHFGLENRQIQADAVIGDNAQGVRLVSGDPRAIGYVSIGEALHAISEGVSIKLVALDGVTPSLETVDDGTFPIRRTLYLLFPATLDDRDQKLLDYVRGDLGRAAIEEFRFIPVTSS